MLLLLPLEEQQSFAEPEWIHFSQNTAFNAHKLHKAENYLEKDPRLEPDDKGYTTQQMGNLAYMCLNGPNEYRDRWRAAHQAFIERAKYIGK